MNLYLDTTSDLVIVVVCLVDKVDEKGDLEGIFVSKGRRLHKFGSQSSLSED